MDRSNESLAEILKRMGAPSPMDWSNAGVVALRTPQITPSAGGTDIALVTISLVSAADETFTGVRVLDLWLSDDPDGIGLTGTAASGTVTAQAGGGTVLRTNTAKKDLLVLTKADGTFVLEVTDTAHTQFYVAVRNPATGRVYTQQILTEHYGT